jgi:hypothetical protein
MCAMKALVVPSPSCWIVWIEGVGDENEYPNNFCVLLDFHLVSVVQRLLIGQGCVVEIVNIFHAFSWC